MLFELDKDCFAFFWEDELTKRLSPLDLGVKFLTEESLSEPSVLPKPAKPRVLLKSYRRIFFLWMTLPKTYSDLLPVKGPIHLAPRPAWACTSDSSAERNATCFFYTQR